MWANLVVLWLFCSVLFCSEGREMEEVIHWDPLGSTVLQDAAQSRVKLLTGTQTASRAFIVASRNHWDCTTEC